MALMKAPWFQPWTMKTADAAYALLKLAAAGDRQAQGQVEAIKKLAKRGNVEALQALAKFDAVAVFVTLGRPQPSAWAELKRLRQAQKTAAVTAVKKQQQQTVDNLKRTAARQVRLMQEREQRAVEARRQASLRVNERRAEQARYEDELGKLQDELQRRDIAEDKRAALVAQATAYEQKIAAFQGASQTDVAVVEQQIADEAAAAEDDILEPGQGEVHPGDVDLSESD